VLLVAARVLAPAVVLTAFGLLVAGVIPVSPWTWAAMGVLFAAVVAAASDRLGAWDTAGVPRRVFAAMSLLLGFVLLYYLSSRLLATEDDWALAVILAFLLAFAVALGIGLGMPRVRRRWLGEPGQDSDVLTGVLGPFAWLAVLVAIMTSVFASVTLFAAEKDLISLTAAGVDLPSFEKIAQTVRLAVLQVRPAPGHHPDSPLDGSVHLPGRGNRDSRLALQTRRHHPAHRSLPRLLETADGVGTAREVCGLSSAAALITHDYWVRVTV
jgi:hypothetical protein